MPDIPAFIPVELSDTRLITEANRRFAIHTGTVLALEIGDLINRYLAEGGNESKFTIEVEPQVDPTGTRITLRGEHETDKVENPRFHQWLEDAYESRFMTLEEYNSKRREANLKEIDQAQWDRIRRL